MKQLSWIALLLVCMVGTVQAQTGGWGCTVPLPTGSGNMNNFLRVYSDVAAYLVGVADTTYSSDTTMAIDVSNITRGSTWYKMTPYYLCAHLDIDTSFRSDSMQCKLVTERSNDGVNWKRTDSLTLADTLVHPLDSLLLSPPSRYVRIIQRAIRGKWLWKLVGPSVDPSTWTSAVLEYRVYPTVRH